jgi:predicted HAD superfamily Cof-like phosphohydrolase
MSKPEYNPNGTLRSTSDHYDAVKAFTVAMGQPVGADIADMAHGDLMDMRRELIEEEADEVARELPALQLPALLTDGHSVYLDSVDKAALTKELADLLYVTYGFAVTFGLPIDEVFERVHRSNMSKLGDDGKPIYRDDGKVLKAPNYQPPKLDDLFDVSV